MSAYEEDQLPKVEENERARFVVMGRRRAILDLKPLQPGRLALVETALAVATNSLKQATLATRAENLQARDLYMESHRSELKDGDWVVFMDGALSVKYSAAERAMSLAEVVARVPKEQRRHCYCYQHFQKPPSIEIYSAVVVVPPTSNNAPKGDDEQTRKAETAEPTNGYEEDEKDDRETGPPVLSRRPSVHWAEPVTSAIPPTPEQPATPQPQTPPLPIRASSSPKKPTRPPSQPQPQPQTPPLPIRASSSPELSYRKMQTSAILTRAHSSPKLADRKTQATPPPPPRTGGGGHDDSKPVCAKKVGSVTQKSGTVTQFCDVWRIDVFPAKSNAWGLGSRGENWVPCVDQSGLTVDAAKVWIRDKTRVHCPDLTRLLHTLPADDTVARTKFIDDFCFHDDAYLAYRRFFVGRPDKEAIKRALQLHNNIQVTLTNS